MQSENSINMAITIIIITVNLQSSSNSSSVSFVKSSRPCCHRSSTPGQPLTFPLASAPRGDPQRPYQQGFWALWLPVGSSHCRGSTGDWREEEKREQSIYSLKDHSPPALFWPPSSTKVTASLKGIFLCTTLPLPGSASILGVETAPSLLTLGFCVISCGSPTYCHQFPDIWSLCQ